MTGVRRKQPSIMQSSNTYLLEKFASLRKVAIDNYLLFYRYLFPNGRSGGIPPFSSISLLR